jgi:hypothetical protein
VKVCFCRPVSFPAIRKLEGLAYKRAAYWHNTARNQVISVLAASLAAGHLQPLWEHGLLLDEPEDLFELLGHPPRVAVLVESLEHARELQRHLAGWTVCTTHTTQDNREISRAAAHPAAAMNAGHIVTIAYAAQHGLAADFVVRANGGTGLPPIKNFPPPRKGEDNSAIYLIDFTDDFDSRTRREAISRQHAYQSRGWQLGQRRRSSAGISRDTQDNEDAPVAPKLSPAHKPGAHGSVTDHAGQLLAIRHTLSVTGKTHKPSTLNATNNGKTNKTSGRKETSDTDTYRPVRTPGFMPTPVVMDQPDGTDTKNPDDSADQAVFSGD